ncbi:TrfB-related DNA-binding protein [Azorhizophilus paspali]|uniref:TrfB-related DNA-binding protein n=1 Tax=Azorhizophilus paspali TaxID=69963 RepID=UPI0036399908
MSDEQFEALAELLRMRGSASQEAARLVLVEALSAADAARATGVSPQAVSNAVTTCRRGLSLAQRAAGLDIHS